MQSGRSRALVAGVRPSIENGIFPAKRGLGESLEVDADVIADGHEKLGCVLRWHRLGESTWREMRMIEDHNDLWRGRFVPDEIGLWEYQVQAWVDPFLTWRHDLRRRIDAGQNIQVDLQIGGGIIGQYAETATAAIARTLKSWAKRVTTRQSQETRGRLALSDELADLMWDASPRTFAAESRVYRLDVDRPIALHGAWYEMFPRSAAKEPGQHGTFADVQRLLPYVESMNFDVLYLPPIHPIGRTARKGRNNTTDAGPNDVGSPWAIGSDEGGHKDVHPKLGTLRDFDRLVKAAAERHLEIALDMAFQCSPDHPYVQEHPEWFKRRPDGSIQYAENPPKKYQDIYPFDFECADWQALWNELKSVFLFWIDHGVRIFRVDNPHTKPFKFWDWVISDIRREHPDAVFLSEAFTRPKKMYRLASGGFTQSYTYFAWRNGARELREYVEELASPPICDLFRPSFWPNTPDILPEYLQTGGRPAAMARLVLAATFASNYGIYGPVFELCDFTPRGPGIEENLNSEKYEVRCWNRDDRWSLRHFIARVNRIRRENPALRQFRNITFHHCDNPAHLAYSKHSEDWRNIILCVVNTDPYETHWGKIRLDLAALGPESTDDLVVTDLMSNQRFAWSGPDSVIGLEPGLSHIFRVERGRRNEQDFDYFG